MIKCGRPPKGQEQQSRDRLLDAALKLFLEYGYGNLNMETIAREARVSMRTIYNEFGGKAGLFGALIRRCSDQFVDSLSMESETEEALISFAKQFLYQLTRPDVVRIRAILIGESPRFPDLATQFYDQGPQRTLDHLARFFGKRQKIGQLVRMNPELLADQFLSALRNQRFQKLQLGLEQTPSEAEIDSWARQTTQLFLHGCLKTE